jgi:hypothetical protein
MSISASINQAVFERISATRRPVAALGAALCGPFRALQAQLPCKRLACDLKSVFFASTRFVNAQETKR